MWVCIIAPICNLSIPRRKSVLKMQGPYTSFRGWGVKLLRTPRRHMSAMHMLQNTLMIIPRDYIDYWGQAIAGHRVTRFGYFWPKSNLIHLATFYWNLLILVIVSSQKACLGVNKTKLSSSLEIFCLVSKNSRKWTMNSRSLESRFEILSKKLKTC